MLVKLIPNNVFVSTWFELTIGLGSHSTYLILIDFSTKGLQDWE